MVEHLGDERAVLVVDETGFVKKGPQSVGVQRQYSGTAGRIENCPIGVFLAYAGPKGRTFLDRELYLPKEWAADTARREEAAVPATVEFRTKPQLAREMLERALDAGGPAAWVTGYEIYGGDRRLRLWLEERQVPHVLAVKSTEPLWPRTPWRQVAAKTLVGAIPDSEWERLSAGDGAKGPRVYDWARVPIRALPEPVWDYWLLVRRSVADPTELAYYVCFCPAATLLAELVRGAGSRWAIEESFESAKGEVGLDHYEVRRWPGWYRHITLALLAHAYLTVTRAAAVEKGDRKQPTYFRGRCPRCGDCSGSWCGRLAPERMPCCTGPAGGAAIKRGRDNATIAPASPASDQKYDCSIRTCPVITRPPYAVDRAPAATGREQDA